MQANFNAALMSGAASHGKVLGSPLSTRAIGCPKLRVRYHPAKQMMRIGSRLTAVCSKNAHANADELPPLPRAPTSAPTPLPNPHH